MHIKLCRLLYCSLYLSLLHSQREHSRAFTEYRRDNGKTSWNYARRSARVSAPYLDLQHRLPEPDRETGRTNASDQNEEIADVADDDDVVVVAVVIVVDGRSRGGRDWKDEEEEEEREEEEEEGNRK